MTKQLAIRKACYENNYTWPRTLWTGVMFYDGHKITVDEFMDCVRLFKV